MTILIEPLFPENQKRASVACVEMLVMSDRIMHTCEIRIVVKWRRNYINHFVNHQIFNSNSVNSRRRFNCVVLNLGVFSTGGVLCLRLLFAERCRFQWDFFLSANFQTMACHKLEFYQYCLEFLKIKCILRT